MWTGNVSALGGLLISQQTPAPVTWKSGFGYDIDGALTTATSTSKAVYLGGFLADGATGALITAAATTPTYYIGGFPVNALGALLVYVSQAIPAGTPYIQGIPVGPNGVYCNTLIPLFGTHSYNYIAEATASAPLVGEVHHGLNTADKLAMRYVDSNLIDNKDSILAITTGNFITFNGVTYTVTAPTVADGSNTFAYITISPTTQQPSGLYTFTVTYPVVGPTNGIQMESGSFVLLENGNYLVME
jgi:hypothetical protein